MVVGHRVYALRRAHLVAIVTWLSVKKWETFQHYKDRRPPWIKLYEELLDDTDLRQMTHTTQTVYFRLLLVACRRDNQIPHNIAWLAEELGVSKAAATSGIRALVASGHAISHASKPASGLASTSASSRARTHSQETETETETQNQRTPLPALPQLDHSPGNGVADFEIELDEQEHVQAIIAASLTDDDEPF